MFSTLSCTAGAFIFATIAIIAVCIVWNQLGLHLRDITDSKLAPVSEDYCSPQCYGWLHKNDSCPANPVRSPNVKPENGTV